MKVILKQISPRRFKMRLVNEVEVCMLDHTKIEGLKKQIPLARFVKAVGALYVIHKENDYTDYVLEEILKDKISYGNDEWLDNQTLGDLMHHDDNCRTIAYKDDHEDQGKQDVGAVKQYLEDANDAVSEYYKQVSKYFEEENKANNMEELMLKIIAKFGTEKITKTKVVQKEVAGGMEENSVSSSSSSEMNDDYSFEEENDEEDDDEEDE